MSQSRMAGSAVLAVFALVGAAASAGCGREADEAAPVAQQQAERSIDNIARNVTVQGCLRAGEAANTFVVTTSEAEQEGSTRTYALNYAAGSQPEDLQEHVGKRVEVQGVVRSQQAVTGQTPATPPANEPVGTGGEPRVQTSTTLAVEQLEVSALRPLADGCGEQ
jgi:hypothetical protein